MAEPIGSLMVRLGLDSAKFTDGLKKSKGELSGFAKSAGMAGAAIGAALAGTAVAMGVAIKGAIDSADELSKASQKIGVSVEELSRLKYAADLSDVSLEGLTTGLKKLSASMADVAGGGSSKAAEAFAALGISVTDASGQLKGGGEVLTEVAGKFGAMEDGAGKTALAMAIFGKSGADLIPLLNSGADGLAEMKAEADALGITIDTKTAKSAEAFNDNLTRLKAIGAGLSNQLAAGVLPALESVSNSLVGAAKNTAAMDAVGRVLSGTIRVLATAAVAAGGVFAYLGTIIGGVAQAMSLAVQGQFSAAMGALDNAAARANSVSKATGEAIAAIWTKAAPSTRQAATVSEQLAAPLMQGAQKIKGAGDKAAKEAKDANDKILQAAERAHDSLLNEEEKYLKDWNERRKALDDARRADVISYEQYLDDIERLDIERQGRSFKPVKVSSVDFIDGPEQVEVFDTALGDLIGRLDEARRAADDVAYSVEDIYYGFKNNNWGMAVSGLLKAVQSVQKAFASGTGADKFTALAGVAQGVGSAIGGTAGSAISGAASGALAGFSVAGPVGAVVGGLIGGISSLFGSSKAKKAAKREAEERARQAEAERVARVEAARKELEIRLMVASGDAVGALAKRREYELAALDASLQEQQKAVWAAEDLAEAQAKLAAVSATRRDLEIELMEAMGDSAGALAAQRAEYLKGLDESLRPLQTAVWSVIDANDALAKSQDAVSEAQDVARAAYERDATMFRETIDRFKGIAASLRSYSASIGLAEEGTNSLAAAARNFTKVSTAARLGDEAAMGALEGASEAYRAAGRSQAGSLLEQLRIDAQIKSAVNAAAETAERHATIAEQQLAALTETLPAGLLQVDASVISVHDAVLALNETMAASAALQAQVTAQIAEANQVADLALVIQAMTGRLDDVAKSTKESADTLLRVTRDGTGMVIAA